MDNTKFGPPKGMRDWLPQEALLRQKLIRVIEHHYQLYGFQPIDTPVMENIEVLQGKGGGENEKLMFKILKRGEELKTGWVESSLKEKNDLMAKELHLQNFESGVVDMGLRFDLTVPLARYYANYSNDLPKPFRCYHIGPVWRADRPQKGRYREFYQCDIDIVNGASDSYEVELLLATDRVLKELEIGNFLIRLSDRRLLKLILDSISANPIIYEKMFSWLDKLGEAFFGNQQPEEGYVEKDLIEHFLDCREKIKKIFGMFTEPGLIQLKESFPKVAIVVESILLIQKKVKEVQPDAKISFDPQLVRGLDYYTGPVFEVRMLDDNYRFSIAGGGRYDGLIEKLGGPKGTSAVGISLGFERILLILNEKQKSATQAHAPRVFIANNGQPEKDILELAEKLRSEGIQVEASLENKKLGQQLEAAQKNGIEYAIIDFQSTGIKSYKVRQLSTRQDKEMPLAELYDIMKRLSEEIED